MEERKEKAVKPISSPFPPRHGHRVSLLQLPQSKSIQGRSCQVRLLSWFFLPRLCTVACESLLRFYSINKICPKGKRKKKWRKNEKKNITNWKWTGNGQYFYCMTGGKNGDGLCFRRRSLIRRQTAAGTGLGGWPERLIRFELSLLLGSYNGEVTKSDTNIRALVFGST